MLKENDVPYPSDDHDQEAPGATARFVKVLSESRFGNQVTGTEDLVCMSKGFVPKNTEENTQWACRNICIIFLFCMCSTFLQLKLSLWTSLKHITHLYDFLDSMDITHTHLYDFPVLYLYSTVEIEFMQSNQLKNVFFHWLLIRPQYNIRPGEVQG